MAEYYIVDWGLVADERDPKHSRRILAATEIGELDDSQLEDLKILMPVEVCNDWVIGNSNFEKAVLLSPS